MLQKLADGLRIDQRQLVARHNQRYAHQGFAQLVEQGAGDLVVGHAQTDGTPPGVQ